MADSDGIRRWWSSLKQWFAPPAVETDWSVYHRCPECGEISVNARWEITHHDGYTCPECDAWVGLKAYNGHRVDRLMEENDD